MAAENLKIDFIIGAYAQMRISGLTVEPSNPDLELALERLEDMAAEFFGHNIGVGYFFEDVPDPNTPHNVDRKYWHAFKINLAFRLIDAFGKEMPATLARQAHAGLSFLTGATALIRQTDQPDRMPRGAGSTLRYSRWWRFFNPTARVPMDTESVFMKVDDVDDFVEPFSAYLKEGEDISSFTIEADSGLSIVSSSNTTEDVLYRIKAVGGTTSESPDGVFQVKIVATTTDTRVETRIINFQVVNTDVIDV